MTKAQINPEKVTKPIQLLAAWFVALIVVNGSFLLAAQNISKPEWAAGWLVAASIANVPIFIASLFILQTKFRAQLQEGSYYSEYLHKEREYTNNDSQEASVKKVNSDFKLELDNTAKQILKALKDVNADKQQQEVVSVLKKSHIEELLVKYGSNRSLAELFISKETWRVVVDEWKDDHHFERDIDELIERGLVNKKYKGYKNCELTNLGNKVAELAMSEGKLWSQTHKERWEEEHARMRLNS